MEISWQNVLLGALALVGTTALTILVTRLVNWLLQRRSQLVVEIRVNEVFEAKKLGKNLSDTMRAAVSSWEERQKLPLWKHDIYAEFFDSDKYFKISITNNTPKKIAGLSLNLDVPGKELVQIGSDGDLAEVPGRIPLSLGESSTETHLNGASSHFHLVRICDKSSN